MPGFGLEGAFCLQQWQLRASFGSCSEECVCSTLDEVVAFARALILDYQGRLESLTITDLGHKIVTLMDDEPSEEMQGAVKWHH
jgi:hypothetical protein